MYKIIVIVTLCINFSLSQDSNDIVNKFYHGVFYQQLQIHVLRQECLCYSLHSRNFPVFGDITTNNILKFTDRSRSALLNICASARFYSRNL